MMLNSNWDKIKVPILGFYGLQDHGIPRKSVEELKKELGKNGVVNEFHFYEADHAFFNDTRPSYNKEASRDAWQKLQEWLPKYLS